MTWIQFVLAGRRRSLNISQCLSLSNQTARHQQFHCRVSSKICGYVSLLFRNLSKMCDSQLRKFTIHQLLFENCRNSHRAIPRRPAQPNKTVCRCFRKSGMKQFWARTRLSKRTKVFRCQQSVVKLPLAVGNKTIFLEKLVVERAAVPSNEKQINQFSVCREWHLGHLRNSEWASAGRSSWNALAKIAKLSARRAPPHGAPIQNSEQIKGAAKSTSSSLTVPQLSDSTLQQFWSLSIRRLSCHKWCCLSQKVSLESRHHSLSLRQASFSVSHSCMGKRRGVVCVGCRHQTSSPSTFSPLVSSPKSSVGARPQRLGSTEPVSQDRTSLTSNVGTRPQLLVGIAVRNWQAGTKPELCSVMVASNRNQSSCFGASNPTGLCWQGS